jgi:MATE family multidrug resistance protein
MKQLKDNVIPLLILTIPLALTGLVQSATWFFETLFLAQLGPESLAAGSIVGWLYGTVIVILFGTLSSINILIAHKHGAKDDAGILLIVRDGFWLSLLFALPTTLLFWNMSPIFLVLGQSPAIVLLSDAYLHAIAWGILPTVIVIALLEVMTGLGHARFILLFTVLSVSLTIFFSYSFIFGRFGFPALGIAGAGWGITASGWAEMVFLGAYVLLDKEYQHYFGSVFKLSKPCFLIELLHVGAPMGIMYCVEVSFFLALTLILGSFGPVILAASQIALQYLGTLMSIVFSTAQAITVRMGHLLGAGDKAGAERTAYVGIFFSTVLMIVIGFFYWAYPAKLISIDFDIHLAKNAEIVHYAEQFLLVGALFQVFEAIRISLFGTLRALRDTRFTLFISIISFWGIALPVGYFFATRLSMGGQGLWWGMVLGALISIVLLLWRFKIQIKHYSSHPLTNA